MVTKKLYFSKVNKFEKFNMNKKSMKIKTESSKKHFFDFLEVENDRSPPHNITFGQQWIHKSYIMVTKVIFSSNDLYVLR